MRRLLNTVYVTNELAYLSLDGENLTCKVEDEIKLRIPFENIEEIVCFNYIGCSPALMGKCVSNSIPISFISPTGKFLAKLYGETKGNVHMRVSQIDKFRDEGINLAANSTAAKFANSIQLIKRSIHDNPQLKEDEMISDAINTLKIGIEQVFSASDFDTILGIEGNCARSYFSIFNKLITGKNADLTFERRTKHPPLDPVNAVLSFVYTVYTNEIGAALETVGLDSYIGFYHSLRSGRKSLACDLVEEVRCIAERFVLSLLNLKIISEKDFEKQISGAVYLNDDGRKKVISRWQEKKKTDMMHPFLKQKIPMGLLPYVQANLLAKYVRGDINEYPCFIMK
jgi:CRISPR-associated protein Cas1